MKERAQGPQIRSWAEWFDRRASYYDDPLLKMAYYKDGVAIPAEVMRATIDDVRRKLGAEKGARLLDIGGGVGLFASVFRPLVRQIVSTDISFAMAHGGRGIAAGVPFLVCEAAALPFAPSSFDRLLCYSVFHYLRDLDHAAATIGEFARVTARGGRIMIGDVPDAAFRAVTPPATTLPGAPQPTHYPAALKHDLKQLAYDRAFFTGFCDAKGLRCEILAQDIPGKATCRARFDVMIEVQR